MHIEDREEEDWFLPDERSDREPVPRQHAPVGPYLVSKATYSIKKDYVLPSERSSAMSGLPPSGKT